MQTGILRGVDDNRIRRAQHSSDISRHCCCIDIRPSLVAAIILEYIFWTIEIMIKPVIQIIAADTPATVIPASRSDILSVLFQYIEISVQIGREVVISIFGCVKLSTVPR